MLKEVETSISSQAESLKSGELFSQNLTIHSSRKAMLAKLASAIPLSLYDSAYQHSQYMQKPYCAFAIVGLIVGGTIGGLFASVTGEGNPNHNEYTDNLAGFVLGGVGGVMFGVTLASAF